MHRVYYALGGGRGHLTRARLLRERLGPGTILHQAPADGPPLPDTLRLVRPTPAEVNAHLARAEHVVVDTFPGGIAHELAPQLHDASRTTLIARYVDRTRYPAYDTLAARFHQVLLPYDPERSEWDEPPPGTWIGPVHRALRFEGTCDLLVIGGGEPAAWTPLLADAVRIDGPFDVLPRPRAVVALSAGYNLFYELVSTGLPAAFRPLPRRFDDQFRRAGRFATPLLHRDDLVRFLTRATAPTPG